MTLPPATLALHLADESRTPGGPDATLARLLLAVAGAARTLAREIRRAAMAGNLGRSGSRNVTGDDQKKLDIVGNETMVGALRATGVVAAVVSEELPQAEVMVETSGAFIVCTDPLDGSSNTDVNGAVGTIFGVWRRRHPGPIDPVGDMLRPGREQVMAGYVMYGPATILLYTAGRGTHGFTLDWEQDDWVLTHPSVRCPAHGPYFAANTARYPDWEPGARRFHDALVTPPPPAPGAKTRSYSLRYSGALVADLHRSVIEGGIYFYPADRKNAQGKLRLLYECAPLALVIEQAGGAASTGRQRVLDVTPATIHQRSPLAIGSTEEVALYARLSEGT